MKALYCAVLIYNHDVSVILFRRPLKMPNVVKLFDCNWDYFGVFQAECCGIRWEMKNYSDIGCKLMSRVFADIWRFKLKIAEFYKDLLEKIPF